LRFRGLVAAARHFRERLLAGVEPRERERFLASARTILDDVERSCREQGTSPDELPRQSREALACLREVASTPPESIPPPSEEGVAPKRLRVTNVVRNLDDCLKTLARPDLEPGRADAMHGFVTRSVAGIEEVCRKAGAAPGAMPARSARAYAMLRWLTARENFDRYVAQVGLARSPMERASRALWPGSSREARVLFMPGRTLWRATTCAHAHTWRLAAGFLNAGPEDFDDLARAASSGGGARDVPFVESADFAELEQELDSLLAGEQFDPKGRAHDLDVLFARVSEELFGGALERPNLTWGASATRSRFGSYDRVRDLVTLSPALDDPRLPECVPAFVLFHELLHKKHGFARAGSRRLAHTEEFMEDERRFPERERAREHLDAIARGPGPLRSPGAEPGAGLPGRAGVPGAGPASAVTGSPAALAPGAPQARSPGPRLPIAETVRPVSGAPKGGAAGAGIGPGRVGRNAPCPCGSGRKFKKCCGRDR